MADENVAEILVTFIIPAFNAEKRIANCLDSILKQRHDKFEVIVINDGSSDRTLEICSNFEKKDKRIKVLSIDNSGSAVARNVGLKNAKGKWIAFVDADDWIENNYLTSLIPYLSEQYDFFMFSYFEWKKSKCTNKNLLKNEKVLSAVDLKELVEDSIDTGHRCDDIYPNRPHLWTKLYNKNFLESNDIWFDNELRMAQDIMFNIYVFSKAISAKCLPISLYNYNVLENSTCHRYNIEQLDRIDNLNCKMKIFVEKSQPSNDYRDLLNKRIMVSLASMCKLVYCNKNNVDSYMKRRNAFLNQCKIEKYKDAITWETVKEFSGKKKICMILIKMRMFFLLNLGIRLAS